jgi:uncharacterized protein (TIGR02679 family)
MGPMTDDDGALVLGAPPWDRLLAIARRRLERSGGSLDGVIRLTTPTEAERRLVIGLTGTHRPPGVSAVSVGLAQLDRAMTERFSLTLAQAIATVDGPVRNRPAERLTEQLGRESALAAARAQAGGHAGQPWFGQWLEQLSADGTVTKLIRRGDADLVRQAAAVLALLPVPLISLPVLAERATGNTKALSHTGLATLVLRALALRDGLSPPTSSAQRRLQWESAGVILDDLASQVLVLGIRPTENNVLAGWLRQAADAGLAFRITLQQLTENPFSATGSEIFVCENPAVLRAAAARWGPECRPLVCSEGQPSAACGRLLAQAKGTVRWRGDFDWTGLRTTEAAIDRYGAKPWRMSVSDYLTALAGADGVVSLPETEALRGSPAVSPWDPALAGEMKSRGRAVMEERLLPVLLADLDGSSA